MRTFASCCRVFAWITLILTAFPQIMAAIGIYMWDSVKVFNPVSLIVATALMFVATILFFIIPRGKLMPLIIAAVTGVVFIVLAFQLMDAFPVTVTLTKNAGISLWRAMYRHMTPVFVPLFLLPVWWDYYTDKKALRMAEADRITPTYFETTEDVTEEVRKPKRSVRSHIRKSEDDV